MQHISQTILTENKEVVNQIVLSGNCESVHLKGSQFKL